MDESFPAKGIKSSKMVNRATSIPESTMHRSTIDNLFHIVPLPEPSVDMGMLIVPSPHLSIITHTHARAQAYTHYCCFNVVVGVFTN